MTETLDTSQWYNREWEKFSSLPLNERLPTFRKDNRLFDVLFSQQFDREFLEEIYDLTNKIRSISKTRRGADFLENLLRDKRAMLYFVQPSTRTFLSFINACYFLGIKACEIRDTSISSEVKGESLEDTIRTFSSYVDVIIMRHHLPDIAEKASWLLNASNRSIPIVNGGSGKDQHPTQALLDVYTLMRSFESMGGVDGKTIAMVGDLKRGRTVRSLTYLLKNFNKVHIIFVSPNQFRMEPDILEFLKRHNISYTETENFLSSIKDADAIYMTRIQSEYDAGTTSKSHYEDFALKTGHLSLLKPTTIIMHPFPRRGEIEVEIDRDPRAKYWRQERNGMWVRSALLAHIFGVDEKINGYRAP